MFLIDSWKQWYLQQFSIPFISIYFRPLHFKNVSSCHRHVGKSHKRRLVKLVLVLNGFPSNCGMEPWNILTWMIYGLPVVVWMRESMRSSIRSRCTSIFQDLVPALTSSMNPANVRSLSRRGTHEVREFFSICQMNSLVQLRALTLTYMASSDDPTFQFWTQLSSLKHLRSLIVNFSSYHAVGESLEDQEFLIRSVFNHGFCLALELFKIHISTYVIPRTMTPQLMPTTY